MRRATPTMSRAQYRRAPTREPPPDDDDGEDDDNNDEDDATRHKDEDRPLHLPVDIGPAWLLLSHGAFLAAIVGGSNTSFLFLISNPAHQSANDRALAIMQSAGSVVIGAWTVYAISGTWRENLKLRHPVYGNWGFAALMLIVIYLMAIALTTLVAVILYP